MTRQHGMLFGGRVGRKVQVALVWTVAVAMVGLAGRLAGDAHGATPAAKLKSVLIQDIPHVQQKPDFCGEACVEMALRKLGRSVNQDEVFNQAGLDPSEGRGCYTRDLARAVKALGFDSGPVWHSIVAKQADQELAREFAALHADLVEGHPSIVCMHYDDRPRTTEHFRLVVGYDAKADEVVYHEPAVARAGYQRMARRQFLKLWPLKYRDDNWTLVRLRLKPGRLRDVAAARGLTDADYAQHILQLKKKLPSKDFHIVLQRPFVVIGDESRKQVEQRSQGTVKWAVERIKKDYFAADPDHVIDIWLFKNKASYEKHTWQLFQTKPTTPFGYYSPTNKALVMNISTGGGTLVHEIVHPFMAANFPHCPAWFNEGLASLYEQCGDNRGHIWGYTNWRLRGLQVAVHDDRLPSFKALCSTTTRQFYNDDRGTNYAQARYLCYYLQEKGLLVKYYHQFRAAAPKDPTGYQTLVSILGKPDMEKFQDGWEKYVAQLKF